MSELPDIVAVMVSVSVEGPHGRVLLWASRLLAAALVAGGAILTVDGIVDV